MNGQGLGLLAVVGLTAGSILALARTPPEPTRYTRSHGSSLVTFDDAMSVWGRVPFVREIWVAPDGSGRIHERDEPLMFPSEIERAEWLALGSPNAPAISRSFGPGELVYVRLDQISRDPYVLLQNLSADGAGATEILRRVVLLLYENVPPPELTSAAVSALRQVPGIKVEDRGPLVTFIATDDTRGPRLQSTIVINLTTGQLVSETRVALTAIPSLSAKPPVLMLERMVDTTDLLNP